MNCPKLGGFHLADTSALLNARGDGFTAEDASINVAILIEAFSGLPLLEELMLDICNNVWDGGATFDVLNSRCPKLRSLKLGFFHGISMPVESKLHGVTLCQGLKSTFRIDSDFSPWQSATPSNFDHAIGYDTSEDGYDYWIVKKLLVDALWNRWVHAYSTEFKIPKV